MRRLELELQESEQYRVRAMQLAELVAAMREEIIASGKPPVPEYLQGVDKKRIGEALRLIDRETTDMVDVTFALLDNLTPSWFKYLPSTVRFSHGASVAHLGCHVGILQRGKGKLDREGRDVWIKPLLEVGAVERIYLDPTSKAFVPGHPKPKSPHSAYRLSPGFVEILRADEDEWRGLMLSWSREEEIRERLRFQAEQAEAIRTATASEHTDLITACCDVYAPRFLPGYQVLFIDDNDGERVSGVEQTRLTQAGIEFQLEDPMPDALLWNPKTDQLWIVEAVTSDGEVDQHKVDQVTAFARRNGKSLAGCTTAYPSWNLAAQRQGKHKNIAVGTYIWIREDPAKHYHSESFDT